MDKGEMMGEVGRKEREGDGREKRRWTRRETRKYQNIIILRVLAWSFNLPIACFPGIPFLTHTLLFACSSLSFLICFSFPTVTSFLPPFSLMTLGLLTFSHLLS